jgi:putative superfamily III holin-X
MPAVRQERSIGELFGEFSQDMTLLVRQEIRLARTELGEKAGAVSKRLTSVIAGGVVTYIGALALVAGIILLLTQVVGIPAWLSALLVGIVMSIGGFVTLRAGLRALKTIDPAPRRTVETLKDDVRWAKEMRQ